MIRGVQLWGTGFTGFFDGSSAGVVFTILYIWQQIARPFFQHSFSSRYSIQVSEPGSRVDDLPGFGAHNASQAPETPTQIPSPRP